MEYVFVGKKNVMSDALKVRAEEKLSKVEHLLPAATKVTVTFSAVRELQKIEVTAPLGRRTLRAVATDKDMYNAIDKVVDIVEGQVVKYKSRLKGKSKGNKKYQDEFIENFVSGFEDVQELADETVVRTKSFSGKPMTVEEAILELELLNHNFFVFVDGATDDVAVIYKRDESDYGLIKLDR